MSNARILYVIGSLNVGGAERHLTQVATRLKQRGWEPEVFVLSAGGLLSAVLDEAGIPIHAVHLPAWIGRAVRNPRLRARLTLVLNAIALIKTLWLRRPAVVHFFLPAAYIVGGLASLLSRVPARVMSRRSLNHYQGSHPHLAKLEAFLHPAMTLVCGNSKAVINDLAGEGISSGKLRLIYNGVDFTPYDKLFDRVAERIKNDVPEPALVLVLVANLIAYKGHADLLKALSYIKDSLPQPWLLLCLGRDDGIGAELRVQAQTLRLADHIRWLGSRQDVPDFLRLADIGVLCSHEEGFSNAILEGMAAGLPMVVTDVGGNAEAVLDGATGLVVPAHEPARLAQALLSLANQRNRVDMGKKGLQRAQQNFSMVACIDAYEALYRETGASPLPYATQPEVKD